MKNQNKNQKLIILISIITVIVIIAIVLGISAIRVNIANGEYKSSNSGSNNQNILSEYIKSGITLMGITGTLESLDTSDATATEWDIAYGETAYVDGKKITGLFVAKNNLKIGDFVEYTPDSADAYSVQGAYSGLSGDQSITQDDLKWQILNINDDGTIDLISKNSTNQTLSLQCGNAVAYNNGVFLLNDICKKLYSNNNLGIVARSIKREDIEKHLSEEGINNIYNFNSGANSYGKQRTYYTYIYYPKIYKLENGSGINTTNVKTNGISFSDSYYTEATTDSYARASSSLTGVSTTFRIENNTNNYADNTSYNMIQNNEDYWIASRIVSTAEYGINWGLIKYSIVDGIGGAEVLFGSANNGIGDVITNSIRPIVTIPTRVKIYGGDGTEEHPYKLTV